MQARAVITLLLILCLCATPVEARPRLAQEDASARITPEEEREARELAALFARRFRETLDIEPLMGEMFLDDFSRRLQYEAGKSPGFAIEHNAASQLTEAEFRRFYVSFVNFGSLAIHVTYVGVSSGEVAVGDDVNDDAGNLRMEDIIPPEVAEAFKSDAEISAVLPFSKNVSLDDEGRETLINLEQARSFPAAWGKMAVILRGYILKRQPQRGTPEWEESEKDVRIYEPYVLTLDEPSCNFPAGTRQVFVNVQIYPAVQFQLTLVRIDERLRVLEAAPIFDGD